MTMCAFLVECHWLYIYIALDGLRSHTDLDMKLPRAILTYTSTYGNIRNHSWHTPRSSDLHVLDFNVPTIIGTFLQIPPHLKCHLQCFNPKVSKKDVLMSAYDVFKSNSPPKKKRQIAGKKKTSSPLSTASPRPHSPGEVWSKSCPRSLEI